MLILRRFSPFFCSLKRVHAGIFMLACAFSNEQNKEPILLSIITWFVLGKQNVQAKEVYSQSLYSFTFTAVAIHECIYSHSTTKLKFRKYIWLHLTTYFLFTNIFTHIYGMYRSHSTACIFSHSRSKYSFNRVQYKREFCTISPTIRRSNHSIIQYGPIYWLTAVEFLFSNGYNFFQVLECAISKLA